MREVSVADLEKAKRDIENARRNLMAREASLNAARQRLSELEQDLVEMGVSPENVDDALEDLSRQFTEGLEKLQAVIEELG